MQNISSRQRIGHSHYHAREPNVLFVSLNVSRHSHCFQVEDISEKETQLCHRRFGHLNFRGLNTLAQKQMVIGLPALKISTPVCATCLVGK